MLFVVALSHAQLHKTIFLSHHNHDQLLFSLAIWEDTISLRSSFGDEEDEEEAEISDVRSGSRSIEDKTEKRDVAVRKSFPEAWIFDGDLNLGYTNYLLGCLYSSEIHTIGVAVFPIKNLSLHDRKTLI